MKTYRQTLAIYGSVEVEAKDEDDAFEKAEAKLHEAVEAANEKGLNADRMTCEMYDTEVV